MGVKSRGSWPRSTETRRIAPTMGVHDSTTPGAAAGTLEGERPREPRLDRPRAGAARHRGRRRAIAGLRQPSTRLASVTVGLLAAGPVAGGPRSARALSGPTRSTPPGSIHAIEPPPAPTSARSMTGARIGYPASHVPPKRRARVAAALLVLGLRRLPAMDEADLCGRSAHVERKDVGEAARAPMSAAAMTPAAGPDSTVLTGRTRGCIGAEDAAARLHHEQLRLARPPSASRLSIPCR